MSILTTNLNVIKRDGKITRFDTTKIINAIIKATKASHDDFKDFNEDGINKATTVANMAVEMITEFAKINSITDIDIETVQNFVERSLIKYGYADTAKEYILYREKRSQIRNSKSNITKCIDEVLNTDSLNSDLKRDNANINGDTAMGSMLQVGANVSKQYYLENAVNRTAARNHKNGHIHIHDLDFLKLTVTCCQIDIKKLFKNGFNTGHGFLREPNSIVTAAELAAIAIQSDQNDCHGGQSIPNFDYGLAPYVLKSFKKNFYRQFETLMDDRFRGNIEANYSKDEYDINIQYIEENLFNEEYLNSVFEDMIDSDTKGNIIINVANLLSTLAKDIDNITDKMFDIYDRCVNMALKYTYKDTHQAMEAFIHNCNTLHSRAGAQVPFSSINFGTDTSKAGRWVIDNVLEAIYEGLGHGETAIFPIAIFKVKEGVNYNQGDPNYDLFKKSCKVTAKRLFPNFSFIDAPFNLQYYKENHPETEVAYMGCRTRVLGNVYDKENEIAFSRGNLSFTSINLPRLAIESNGDEEKFFKSLDYMIDIVSNQLLERFEIQARRKVYNFPFLMGQNVWLNSDKLDWNDEVREVLKEGSLSIGFVGLAEALVSLYGHHHAEGEEYLKKGINIISYMRDRIDKIAEDTGMNFSLFATPAESLAGRFLRIDRKEFGIIDGVTDKDFYTNSFHVPVNYNISAFEKINIESNFHSLTNAGHITYVELDGDTTQNVEVIEKIIRHMKESGIGYGSINHPVDRDPECGYTGIIYDECPMCRRKESDGKAKFERIRRITGYLVGTLDKWNDAKRSEEKMRVKHGISNE